MIPDKKRIRKDISRMWALDGSECIRTGCVTTGLLPLVLTFPTCPIVTSNLEWDEAIDSVGSHVSRLNYTLAPILHRAVILVYLTKPLFNHTFLIPDVDANEVEHRRRLLEKRNVECGAHPATKSDNGEKITFSKTALVEVYLICVKLIAFVIQVMTIEMSESVANSVWSVCLLIWYI